MGLDVYLYHYKISFDEYTKKKEEARKLYKKLEKEVEDELGITSNDIFVLHRERYWEILENKCKENNINKYGEIENVREEIEFNSEKYPDHLFKIGYFRSSYNSGGINYILRERIGIDLYDIFNVEDEYYIRPQWEKVLVNAMDARDKFDRYIKQNGSMIVIPSKLSSFSKAEELPTDKESALNVFLEELTLNKSRNLQWDYSNKKGQFFLKEPLKVLALIEGLSHDFLSRKMVPCTYVIAKNDEGFDWYLEALDVVIETCEWVLRKDDPENYILHWSG